MAKQVADHILERLTEWGVTRIFGFPGDGINSLLGALQRAEDRFSFVRTSHEEMAAFMACAHAKFTGEPGVCMATSGPGAIHLLNGLYDAKLDHQPVVAIVGQTAVTALGGRYQQEVDLSSLFKDVAHEYVATIVDAMQVRHCVDRAFRIARSQRTVTCLIVPSDVQSYDAIESPPHAHNTIHSSSAYTTPRVVPQKSDLDRAAAILNAGERVAMLVGAGTLRASEEVEQVAERLSAGVAKALLGKAAVPDTLPYVTGSIGLLGTKPSWDMMQDCDTLLMVGTSFPYAEFLPEEGQARGIQIDIDQRMLGLRYATELNLAGDAKETLQALLPRLRQKPRGSWREGIEKGVADWWHLMEERAMDAANPINPQRVIWELSPRIPENAIVSADSGSVANWFARDLKLRDGMMASLSGNLATMCPGVPYAIAAKFAYPERPVVALVGDGAMQMLGNNGLVTISHYWREWADPRFVILVLHNNDLNQVTWEMRVLEGNARFDASQELVDFNYARLADSLGLRGIEVTRPEDVAGAWEQAFVADRPVVLDMHTDPDVPPLPPHITFEQARHFATSMLKRDSSAVGVMKETARQFVSGFQR